jgi:hypothetical protein
VESDDADDEGDVARKQKRVVRPTCEPLRSTTDNDGYLGDADTLQSETPLTDTDTESSESSSFGSFSDSPYDSI